MTRLVAAAWRWGGNRGEHNVEYGMPYRKMVLNHDMSTGDRGPEVGCKGGRVILTGRYSKKTKEDVSGTEVRANA